MAVGHDSPFPSKQRGELFPEGRHPRKRPFGVRLVRAPIELWFPGVCRSATNRAAALRSFKPLISPPSGRFASGAWSFEDQGERSGKKHQHGNGDESRAIASRKVS